MAEPQHFLNGKVTLHPGDCLDVLATMPENSVDSVVTDPPYHLTSIVKRFGAEGAAEAKSNGTGVYKRSSAGFMGKVWDGGDIAFRPETWAAVLRVMKPGAHLVAFAAPKNAHRMICAIEDAGFEIRDGLMWLFGSGFPKSHDISKAIDRARDDRAAILRVTTFVADAADQAGITRQQIDAHMGTSDMGGWWTSRLLHRCQCPRWEQWLQLKTFIGFGDDMDAEVWRLNGRKGKPGEAWGQREVVGQGYRVRRESVVQIAGVSDGEYDLTAPATLEAARWQGWGTALKPAYEPIVLARKPLSEPSISANVLRWGTGALNIDRCRVGISSDDLAEMSGRSGKRTDGQMLTSMPKTSWEPTASGRWPANIILSDDDEVAGAFPETGPAKAGLRGEQHSGRHGGLADLGANIKDGTNTVRGIDDAGGSAARFFYTAKADSEDRAGSRHPTVKPLDLIQYLCRLICPPGGTILDPFAGTGTTGEAAWREGFRAILIERELEYQQDIARRMEWAMLGPESRARAQVKLDVERGKVKAEALPLFREAAE